MDISASGTFDFCKGCPSSRNCCNRTRQFGEVESPYIFDRERQSISRAVDLPFEEFSVSAKTAATMAHSMKTIDNKCYFYRNGNCMIYNYRPIDCRIFPFDIFSRNSELYWIIYSDLCPNGLSADTVIARYFHAVKALFAEANISDEELRSFSQHGLEVMARHRAKIIEPFYS